MKIAGQFDIPENEILRTAHEGYLFPDTYLIPKEATGSQIVKMMEDNFNKKIQKVREAIKQKGLDFFVISDILGNWPLQFTLSFALSDGSPYA